MLAMAVTSNTSASPTHPLSSGPAFMAFPTCRANRSQAASAHCRYPAQAVRGIPLTSPVPDWMLNQSPTGAAGAGLAWILDNDSSTLPFLFGANADRATPSPQVAIGKDLDWTALVPQITREPFRPDGNLNVREIPISLQLPDWNHWLPQLHPLDAWGPAFGKSEFAEWYGSVGSPQPAGGRAPPSASKPSLRNLLAAPDLSALISSGRIVTYFDKWRDARRAFLKPYVEGNSVNWTPYLGCQSVFHSALATGKDLGSDAGVWPGSTRARVVWAGWGAAHLGQHDSRGHGSSHGQHS